MPEEVNPMEGQMRLDLPLLEGEAEHPYIRHWPPLHPAGIAIVDLVLDILDEQAEDRQ